MTTTTTTKSNEEKKNIASQDAYGSPSLFNNNRKQLNLNPECSDGNKAIENNTLQYDTVLSFAARHGTA